MAFPNQVQHGFADFEKHFNLPYADILEMPIFDFLNYWIYRTL
jgi:hypothetical protein